MWRRLKKIILSFLVAFLLISASVIGSLQIPTVQEWTALWVQKKINTILQRSGWKLQFSTLKRIRWNHLTWDRLQLSNATYQLDAQKCRMEWSPASLFFGTLTINALTIEQLQLQHNATINNVPPLPSHAPLSMGLVCQKLAVHKLRTPYFDEDLALTGEGVTSSQHLLMKLGLHNATTHQPLCDLIAKRRGRRTYLQADCHKMLVQPLFFHYFPQKTIEAQHAHLEAELDATLQIPPSFQTLHTCQMVVTLDEGASKISKLQINCVPKKERILTTLQWQGYYGTLDGTGWYTHDNNLQLDGTLNPSTALQYKTVQCGPIAWQITKKDRHIATTLQPKITFAHTELTGTVDAKLDKEILDLKGFLEGKIDGIPVTFGCHGSGPIDDLALKTEVNVGKRTLLSCSSHLYPWKYKLQIDALLQPHHAPPSLLKNYQTPLFIPPKTCQGSGTIFLRQWDHYDWDLNLQTDTTTLKTWTVHHAHTKVKGAYHAGNYQIEKCHAQLRTVESPIGLFKAFHFLYDQKDKGTIQCQTEWTSPNIRYQLGFQAHLHNQHLLHLPNDWTLDAAHITRINTQTDATQTAQLKNVVQFTAHTTGYIPRNPMIWNLPEGSLQWRFQKRHHFQINAIPLQFFHGIFPEKYAGILSGHATYERALHYDLKLADFRTYDNQLWHLASTGTLSAKMLQGNWTIYPLRSPQQLAHMHYTLPLNPTGGIDVEQPIQCSLEIDQNLAPLTQMLLPSYLELKGHCNGKLALSGSLTEPTLSGYLEWQKGALYHHTTGVKLQDLHAGLRAWKNRIKVRTLQGADTAQGRLTGSGHFTLHQGLTGKLSVHLDKLLLLENRFGRATFTGTLKAEKLADDISVEGTIAADSARLMLPHKSAGLAPSLITTFPQTTTHYFSENQWKILPRVLFNIAIQSGTDTLLRGRGLNCHLNGDLLLQGDLHTPTLRGRLHTQEGFFEFSNHRFTILQGQLQFNGRPDTGYLHLVAERALPLYTIRATLQGPLHQPRLTFDTTEDGVTTKEIVSQLFFNQDYASITPLQALQVTQYDRENSAIDSVSRSIGVDFLSIQPGKMPQHDNNSYMVAVGKSFFNGRMLLIFARELNQQVNKMSLEAPLHPALFLTADIEKEQPAVTLKYRHRY